MGCSFVLVFFSTFASWFAMSAFMVSFNFASCLENRTLIVLVGSVFVPYYELEGEIASVVVSVEVVDPEYVFVKGDMTRNKYWVGILKCSEE